MSSIESNVLEQDLNELKNYTYDPKNPPSEHEFNRITKMYMNKGILAVHAHIMYRCMDLDNMNLTYKIKTAIRDILCTTEVNYMGKINDLINIDSKCSTLLKQLENSRTEKYELIQINKNLHNKIKSVLDLGNKILIILGRPIVYLIDDLFKNIEDGITEEVSRRVSAVLNTKKEN